MHSIDRRRIGVALETGGWSWLGLTFSLGLLACHNDDSGGSSGSSTPDSGQTVVVARDGELDGGRFGLDGGSGALDAGPAVADAGPTSLEAAVIGIVADYDDQVRTNCPCYVRMGSYASVQECVGFLGSGPEWVSCATRFLAARDSPEVREIFRCYGDQTRAYTACLAMASCDADKRALCPAPSLDCFQSNPGVGLLLSMACPDISLLPRL